MTKGEDRSKMIASKELGEQDEDFVRAAVLGFVQVAPEAETPAARAAAKGERPDLRLLPRRL